MFLGIDLGTSAVKLVVMNPQGELVAQSSAPLLISRPFAGWSEQHPEHWWQSVCQAIDELKQSVRLADIQAIGLSGQMHGATLLDKKRHPLRPAILWNDSRSFKECQELEELTSDFAVIGGNPVMPGFTAPKIRWIQKYEPDIFQQTSKVLLPKDYINLKLTGECASDMSDSAGTLWLDIARRDWSDSLLDICGLDRGHMPELHEGCEVSGFLRKGLATQWGMKQIPVVAGAGDNAAGALGAGIIKPGQAMLSLGTSGVLFVVTDGYHSNPAQAVHSFCHALPDTWHLMSVMLSAACCLDWLANLTGAVSVSALLKEAEIQGKFQEHLVFLPYLGGERTPHNNPAAKGVFFGMGHDTCRADLTLAVLEGVSMGLKEGLQALQMTGVPINDITLIGGGTRSELWRQLLATILEQTLNYRAGSEVGPGLGAARLAMLGTLTAHPGKSVTDLCPVPALSESHRPDRQSIDKYRSKYHQFKSIYQSLKSEFAKGV